MTTAAQSRDVASVGPPPKSGIAEAIRVAYESSRPVFPLGGRTALAYGSAPTPEGLQLDMTELSKVVDYTPRDMTILVEAGIRMAKLAAILDAEGQHLPIDVPRAGDATLGGVVATNWSGPRRYGHGTIRDYVIGINAVDGRGVAFKAGGRVVKNVAGYDFCKLLCGSLGTLAVITQLALKVKPKPETSAAILANCVDLTATDALLSRLVNLPAPPVAIDLLIGDAWDLVPLSHNPRGVHPPRRAIPNPQSRSPAPALVIRVEGTEVEVASLAEQTQYELWSGGATAVRRMEPTEADALSTRQVEFSDRGAGETHDGAPLVVKIAVPPSQVTTMIGALLQFDANCTVQAHAASGIIVARFAKFSHSDVTGFLVAKLRPAAISHGGSVVVISTTLEGLTPHVIWGGRTEATVLLERVKQQFDPRNILNPAQIVF